MAEIQPTEIVSVMKAAYLNYAMSVIVARALPDIRDGLKPVHRRILYAMYKLGLTAGAKYSKSAKVVGEVLGKYHPHGDSSVYEALVRMAQDFSMRYPLVHGQGNFGSIDGDPPAAMRYTEVKLMKIAEEMLTDIEKNTVAFTANFDGTIEEPVYLPAKLPNLLLMGAEGIAVGMATKIPPHNLSEIVDGLCVMIDQVKIKPEFKQLPTTMARDLKEALLFTTSLDELLLHIKGPDFPTRGIIYGQADIREAFETGRGKILVRGKIKMEEIGKREAIIINELPYQVNKAHLVSKIAQLVIDKKINGISDLRDESDREGIRVVIELKRDASYKKVLNNLYKHTNLQISFPINTVVLTDGVPRTLSLKQILEAYLKHRVDVVIKRSEYELEQAEAKAHILQGYLIALDNIDEVVEIIKKSQDEAQAKKKLITRFGLSELQAQAILDMQLKRLTGLEREKIEDQLALLQETIDYLKSLLTDIFKIFKVIKDEILYLKKKYGDERRTKIVKYRPGKITDEQLIENKEEIIVLTKGGYIKRIPRETFKVQHRGGKGVSGMSTKENDDVSYINSTMTHNYILFFTDQGRVFKNHVWEIPQGSRKSKGKAIINLLSLRPGEKVTSILTYKTEKEANRYIFMVTKKGTVKKTPFTKFANIRTNGIIAIKLDKDDRLLWVKLTDGDHNILLISERGKAIIFPEAEVRPTGRNARGVRGIKLAVNDQLTSADVFKNEEYKKRLFVLSERGVGKKTKLSLFRDQHRGGVGVKVASVDKRNGKIIFTQIIEPDNKQVIITSKKGQVVKIPLKGIPPRSRNAKGVILMRFSDPEDAVADATFL